MIINQRIDLKKRGKRIRINRIFIDLYFTTY